jgi:hypothetical protein
LPATFCTVILDQMSDVTAILSAIEQGDPDAAEQLLPLVFDELRQLAAPTKPGKTLQAMAVRHLTRALLTRGRVDLPPEGMMTFAQVKDVFGLGDVLGLRDRLEKERG